MLELPRMKPTIKSQAFFEGLHIDSKTLDAPPPMPDKAKMDKLMDEEIRFDLSNLNPPIASPAFFAGVDIQRLRKEHLAIGQTASDASSSQVGTEARPVKLLMRSASNPVSTRAVLVDHHPKKWPRAESADTTASSPRTDGTENAWNLSTAPTSAAATPAPGSMRQSSQSARQGSEKFLTADIEWMRSELERHKREQDEAKARRELDNQVLASLGLNTGSDAAQQSSKGSAQAPVRKPLPAIQADGLLRGRSTNQSIQERRNVPPVAQLSATPSRDASRSAVNRQHSVPRSENAQELYMRQAESSESQAASRRGSQTSEPRKLRSLSREFREYFGGSSDAAVSSGDDVSRASSRSRRLFQLNPRPRDGTRAPLASIESSKPQSRSRSIESIRSAVSAVAPSLDSAASKLRSWKSSRTGESTTTNDTSRSGSSLSKRHSRDFSRELQMSPDSHKRGKSSVNLNRELPPLPSIDQWKPAEPEKPKHIVSMASPKRFSLGLSGGAAASAPNLADFGPVSPLPGPGTYSSSTSRIQSIYSRYSKISDGWLPPLSAGASPTVQSPLPQLGQNADRYSSIGDSTGAESFPASPAYAVVDPRQASFPASPAYMTTDEQAQQVSSSIPPSPAYLTVESQQQRIPSEYMFRSNFGALLPPSSPLSVPVVLDTTPPQRAVTIKRRTEDMFLPDLDARARNESSIVGPPAASKEESSSGTPAKTHIINYSRSLGKKKTDKAAPAPGIKRQNTAPILHSAAAASSSPSTPSSHSKSVSDGTNFSRVKPTSTAATPENYTRLYDMGYRNIVQIQPQDRPGASAEIAPDATAAATAAAKSATLSVLPERKDSKRWWKRGTSKKIARKGSGAQAPALAQVGEYMHADESAPTVVRF